MNSLEIKVSLSGEELLALQALAGTTDIKTLRDTARTVLKTTLLNAQRAMKECLQGTVAGMALDGNGSEEEKEKE